MRQIQGANLIPVKAGRTVNLLQGTELQVVTAPRSVEIRAVLLDPLLGTKGVADDSVQVVDLAAQYISFKVGQNELSRQALDIVPRYIYPPDTQQPRPTPPPNDMDPDDYPEHSEGDLQKIAAQVQAPVPPTGLGNDPVRRIGITEDDIIYAGQAGPGNLFLRVITTDAQPANTVCLWDVKYGQ